MNWPEQTWPMPTDTDTDATAFRRRCVSHADNRTSPLHDWAGWVAQAPLPVIEEHLSAASPLDPSLADLGLSAPMAAWSEGAWSRLWAWGGHTAWAQMCSAVRHDDTGEALLALRQALIATDRVDAVSVLLWRLRTWDRDWTREVIAQRVERHCDDLVEVGAEQGVDIVEAVVSPVAAALHVNRSPLRPSDLANAGARRVGVPVLIQAV